MVIFTPEEMLKEGLTIFHTHQRINGVKGDPWESKTNSRRFKDHCACSQHVAVNIWEDLQTAANPEARVEPNVLSIQSFLEAFHFLHRHKRESEREATFDRCPKTIRKHCWCYLKRIQALKAEKIVFTQNFGADEVWIMTVDGTHNLMDGPIRPVFSQDSEAFSHKKNHAGMCHELGIDLFESKLMWMNGPFKAGKNDNWIFRNGGPKDKLAAIGKKALADKGYNGHPNECSTFNAMDGPAVKMLKSRAQMRHEQFNGMLKEFSCLDDRFRHKSAKCGTCFEATAVICQHRMDHGEPLFDVLAGVRIEEEE